jgi:hypothetical protein
MAAKTSFSVFLCKPFFKIFFSKLSIELQDFSTIRYIIFWADKKVFSKVISAQKYL